MNVIPKGTGPLSLPTTQLRSQNAEQPQVQEIQPSPPLPENPVKITTGPLSPKVLDNVSFVDSPSFALTREVTFPSNSVPTAETKALAQTIAQLSNDDQECLIAALATLMQGNKSAVTSEQQALLQKYVPQHLQQQPKALYEETLIANAVQTMKGAVAASGHVAIYLLNQINNLAKQPNVTEEQVTQTLTPIFVKMSHAQNLYNPDLVPLLPRLADALKDLRLATSQANLLDLGVPMEIGDVITTSDNQALNQSMEEMQKLSDQIELNKRELEHGIPFKIKMQQTALSNIDQMLQDFPLMDSAAKGKLSAQKLGFEKELQKVQQQKSKLEHELPQLEKTLQKKQAEYSIDNKLNNYFGLRTDQRQNINSDMNLAPQLDQMMLTHQHVIGPEMGDYMKQVLTQGNTSDPSQSPQLNLNEHVNFALVQMLHKDHQADVKALQDVLVAMDNKQDVNPACNSHLKKLGLFYNQGKLLNLAGSPDGSPTPLSVSELAALKAVSDTLTNLAQKSSTLSNNVPLNTQDGMNQAVLERITAASDSLESVQQMRSLVEQRVEALEQSTAQLGKDNEKVEKLHQEVEQLTTQVTAGEEALKRYGELTAKFKSLGSPEAIKDYLRQLARDGKLDELKTFLHKEFNIDIDVHGKEVDFNVAGKTFGSERLLRVLDQQFQPKRQGLEALRQQVMAKKQVYEQAHRNLAQTQKTVDTQQQELNEVQGQYAKQLNVSQQSLAELKDIKSQPALWNQLPPATQKQVDALIAQMESEHKRSGNLLSRVKHALQTANTQRERTQHNQLRGRELMAKLDAHLKGLEKSLQKSQPLLESELSEKVAELVALANQMQANLSLNPRPANVNVADLADTWHKELEANLEACEQLQATQQNNQTMAAKFSKDHLAQMKDHLTYHLQQLKTLDQRSHERLETLLQHSIQGIPALLQTKSLERL